MPVTIKIKPKVIEMLEKYPHLRDCDEKLLANIWHQEADSMGIDNLFAFLRAYSEGKLTNSESCRRTRQKIQQENPNLRGKSYNERHENTKKIRSELGYSS